MFNFINLKFLTSKKILASVVAVTGSATATYFWWKAQGEGNGISQQVATTRAKLERSRPNYSQLFPTIPNFYRELIVVLLAIYLKVLEPLINIRTIQLWLRGGLGFSVKMGSTI
ncbi:hypothetical protein MHF_0552 [Mycoplasma haemofelis Ohio2]|uniref:Uncharacterized protein n=1 Tax=Mycoplasma haemofelis (strain Ohio2) TaxID=859194 RepID=F6FHX6_MYCHI|nr:hypothetical protein MHF_0552 [Mycoplasma haemofelis Ohio2]